MIFRGVARRAVILWGLWGLWEAPGKAPGTARARRAVARAVQAVPGLGRAVLGLGRARRGGGRGARRRTSPS